MMMIETLEGRALCSVAPVLGAAAAHGAHGAGHVLAVAKKAAKAAKAAVTHVQHVQANVVTVIDLAHGTFHSYEAGKATFFGNYVDTSSGTFDPTTGAGQGSGTVYTQSGDKVFYNVAIQVLDPATGKTMTAVTVTGGTGKFAGATGGYQTVVTPTHQVQLPGLIIATISEDFDATLTF